MPFKSKKSKKTYRKRPYRKRTYRRRRLVSNSVPSGMPVQRVAKLRYVEKITLSSTVGGLQTWVWGANNIFDPNVSGTGHQPMGHDQWAGLFNHYVVLGSKIHLQVSSASTPISPAYCGVYLTDSATAPYSNYEEYIEARKGEAKLISQDSTRTTHLNNKFSAKKFFNVKDVKDNIDRLGALVGVSPNEQAYYASWYQTANGSTDTAAFLAVIDYIVLYSEPKDLTKS